MAFTLKIETDNAAFDDDQGEEVARILRSLADMIADTGNDGGDRTYSDGSLRDINGNTVGHWTLDPREDN